MLKNTGISYGSSLIEDDTDIDNDATSTKIDNYDILKNIDINYKPAQGNNYNKVYSNINPELNANCSYSENTKTYLCYSEDTIHYNKKENNLTVNNTMNNNDNFNKKHVMSSQAWYDTIANFPKIFTDGKIIDQSEQSKPVQSKQVQSKQVQSEQSKPVQVQTEQSEGSSKKNISGQTVPKKKKKSIIFWLQNSNNMKVFGFILLCIIAYSYYNYRQNK